MSSMKSKADVQFQQIMISIYDYRHHYGVPYEDILNRIRENLRETGEGYPSLNQSSIYQYLNEGDGI